MRRSVRVFRFRLTTPNLFPNMAGASRNYVPEMWPKYETTGKSPSRSREAPLDIFLVCAGVTSIVAGRNLLARGIKNWVAVDREDDVGGGWYRYWPTYSTLQVLKSDWKVHGVEVPGAEEPSRRSSRESVCNWVSIFQLYGAKEFLAGFAPEAAFRRPESLSLF